MINTNRTADIDFESFPPARPLVSDARMNLIRNLRSEWQAIEDEAAKFAGRPAARPAWKDPETAAEASAMITKAIEAKSSKRAERDMAARAARVQASPVTAADVTEGMWTIGEDIFKVQVAVHGSGRLYAKRLTADGFERAVGAMARIAREGTRMTAEQAKTYGSLYGRCVACSRTLTDETSIGHGYGQTCAENNGWPY
jgi:hypothetical protein